MSRLTTIALACLLSAPALAQVQEEPAARFGERLEVTEVLVDVVAFDRDGEAVPDLGVEDFVVTEDGRPVELTGVSFYTTWYDPAGYDDADLVLDPAEIEHRGEIPSSRYFILFFHDPRYQDAQPFGAEMEMLLEQRRAGFAARRWLADGLQPSDWVAVVGYRGELLLYQDFTQDRDALAEAVKAAAASKPPPLLAPSRRPRPPRSGSAALRRTFDRVENLKESTARVEDALRLVAEASAHVVGRKNLFFFTPGLGEEPRRDDPEHPSRILERALNAHNVALYAVDLGGPAPRGVEERVALGSGGAFFAGLRFHNTLTRVARENRGYYVLSYRTPRPTGDESVYRELEIEARDRRIRVRARSGFEVTDQ